jgi:alcohol dehydrogenase
MKGVVFEGVEQVAWRDLPDPAIEAPGDAIVAVELAGMCGSDLHPYFGREAGLDAGTVMGHEFVGRVVETGPAVKSLGIGDRVFAPFSTSCGQCYYCLRGLTSRCGEGQLFGWRSAGRGLHGGQAQLVRVPLADGSLLRVPEGLSAESALLLGDNFSTGYFCAELGAIDPQGVTAVIGCGSVGLLAVIAARLLGAEQVVAIDPVAARRALAAKRGATTAEPGPAAVALVRELTQGRGADSVLELVGLPAAQSLAFELIRAGGTMAVIGCHTAQHFSFSPVDAYDRNLTYRTGRCPARHYMSLLSARVAADEVEIDSLITHRFAPVNCVPAYDLFAHQRDGCIKAVLEFSGV